TMTATGPAFAITLEHESFDPVEVHITEGRMEGTGNWIPPTVFQLSSQTARQIPTPITRLQHISPPPLPGKQFTKETRRFIHYEIHPDSVVKLFSALAAEQTIGAPPFPSELALVQSGVSNDVLFMTCE